MSALEEVIAWAQGLPAWQADAVRRLLEQGVLTVTDLDDLYPMAKQAHGLATDCSNPVFPKIGGLSGTGHGQLPITLERIRDIQHVNAVKNGSTMPFALRGLTVIYGQNGSGKSSYARILKRACRARDTKDPIHQNVFDAAELGPATAVIKISDGNTRGIELPWTDGVEADTRLARVSFFDSKCARVIVDENNEAAYIPYGCQVFDGLVELIKTFRARLQAERPNPSEPSVPGVVAGTQASEFLRQLSRNTRPQEIEAATIWGPTDEDELGEILARIAQSKTKENLSKARRVRSIAERAKELALGLEAIMAALSMSAVRELNVHIDQLIAATKAAELAAKSDLQGEPLPAGASNEWRVLFDAARKYSQSVAYIGLSFPATDEGRLCVLCQQPFSGEAAARMLRFRQFVEQETEQLLKKARATMSLSITTLSRLEVPKAGSFADVLSELTGSDRAEVQAALDQLDRLKSNVLAAMNAPRSIVPDKSPQSVTGTLTQLKISLDKQAVQAERDADPGSIDKIESRRDELISRRALSQASQTIHAFVADSQRAFSYDQCIGALTTRFISEKSKEIISAALSPQLQGDLKSELGKLGASYLPLKVNITGREGGARHQLALVNLTRRAKLSAILSEGEQCVVAVAGFLAELGGESGASPVVLDDPVTSLDHRFTRYIAKRLVDEAKKRQVIVFTHNIGFLVEIEKLSGGLELCVQTVQRSGKVAGYCMEGLPWEAMSVKDRLKYIDEKIAELIPLHIGDEGEYNSRAAVLYDLLRQTWEAAIERDLLFQTVVRHDCDVQTQRLQSVEVLDDDYVQIDASMTKCSEWMAGHDKSMALDVNRPSPDEIRSDVQGLREFLKVISARREKVRERRKSLLGPRTSQLG